MDQQSDMINGGARSLSSDALVRLRRQVVAAVESGVPQSHAARMFGVSRKTVGTWVRAYQANGEQAFLPRRRGRRSGERLALSATQQAWVVKTVADSPPDEVGLPYLLWTRRAIAELIRGEFAITLSAATVDQYLARWDLITESHPLARPGRASSEELSPASADGEKLWVAWTCSDSPTDSDPLHALVAVTNRGVLLFLVSERPFDRGRLADFRKRLRVQLARDVSMVVRAWPIEQFELLSGWQDDEQNVTVCLATR
jgi:transposase